MTRLHLNRRMNWRFSALGLVLSLGLIFGASGVIRLNAAEREHASARIEEVCDPGEHLQRAEFSVPVVPSGGHQEDERNL